DLSQLSPRQWVSLLSHPNAWHRDTARRLIVQQGASRQIVRAVKREIRSSKDPVAIINSLWTLHGLNAIDWSTVQRYMRHEHDWVAMTAAAVGEALPKRNHKAYRKQLLKMAESGYPRALQAAVSVSAIDGGHEISRHVLKHYLNQPYTREAVISGLGQEAEAFIASLGDDKLDDKTQYLLNNLGKRTQDESNRAQLSPQSQALFDLGEQVFHGKAACAACHGSAGSGQAGVA